MCVKRNFKPFMSNIRSDSDKFILSVVNKYQLIHKKYKYKIIQILQVLYN